MGGVIDQVVNVASLGTIQTDMGGERATRNAINAQTNAAADANRTALDIFNMQRNDLEPWRQTGMRALAGLEKFDMNKDPGYQFRLNEGMKAIEAAGRARGNNNSSSTMKNLLRYNSDYASNEFGNAYNRAAGLAGIGQAATNNIVSAAGNYGQTVGNNQIGVGNANGSAQIAQANRNNSLIGQGLTAGALAFSDERLKTNITPISKADMDEMRPHLKAFAFNYKNDKFGKGDWVGVMAQDLEKSKLGKTLVVTNKKGQKQIDLDKVLSLFLASLAEA